MDLRKKYTKITAGKAVNVKTATPYAEVSVVASLESAPMIAIVSSWEP